MQSTSNKHDFISEFMAAASGFAFNDAPLFDFSNGMFNDYPLGSLVPVLLFLLLSQLLASGFLPGHAQDGFLWAEALETAILQQLYRFLEFNLRLISYFFVMHAALVGLAQVKDPFIAAGQYYVFDGMAFFHVNNTLVALHCLCCAQRPFQWHQSRPALHP
jgi:hypothetical protein